MQLIPGNNDIALVVARFWERALQHSYIGKVVLQWGLFFLHTWDGLSCVRLRKSARTKAIHNAMIHTNSATGSTILSTLLTKFDYRGTIGIALTINTSIAKEEISLKSLAITYHTKPPPKCMQITICKITMPRLSRGHHNPEWMARFHTQKNIFLTETKR